MAGYVGNLISYHDRREGGLSEFGVRRPEQLLMGAGTRDVMEGRREDLPIMVSGVRHVIGRHESATSPFCFPGDSTSRAKGRRSITINHHIRNA